MLESSAPGKSAMLEEHVVRHVLPRYEPGERIPAESALAKELGTSRTTMHKVLSALVSKGLLYRVNGVGTFLSTQKTASKVITMVIPSSQSLDRTRNPSWFNGQLILESFSRAARESGYSLDLVFLHPDEQPLEESVKELERGQGDGFVLPILSGYKGIVERLSASGHVCVARSFEPDPVCNVVYGNLTQGVYDAVDFLIRSGRKRVAYFALNNTSGYERCRYEGWRRALEAHGMEPSEELVHYCGGLPEAGYECVRQLIAGGLKADAIFAGSDMRATGIMRALREAGLRVPEDVAVVGADNIPECLRETPPLATVDYPLLQIGRALFEMLTDVLANPGAQPIARELRCRFVQRESCGGTLQVWG